MSARGLALRRTRQAMMAAAAAALLLALGVGAVWRDAAAGARPDVSGPVAPGWRAAAANAQLIEIIAPDSQFMLVREESGWVMPSRGGYPVRPERIAELDAALSGLRFERAMTRDPAKYDRLGVGDPLEGGDGVRLSIFDARSNTLAALVAGREGEGGTMFVRPAGSARSYAVSGRLPELSDPGRWLGLDFWDIGPRSIVEAHVRPETGPSWRAARPSPAQRNFTLEDAPGWRLVTGGAANGAAMAGGQLRFRDVKPREDLAGAVVAGHSGMTAQGLAYRFDFIAEDDERWAVIEVRAVDSAAAAEAGRLNAFVEGWAFLVSGDAYERLTRPLAGVAEPAPG